MTKKALIDSDDVIVNVIEADASYSPPDGLTLVDAEGKLFSPGEIYDPGTDTSQPTVADRKAAMLVRADERYQSALATGFSYDGGTFSLGSPARRQRVLEIVGQVNAGRGLPNGKTSKVFYDESGTAHDLNATQVLDMGEAANSLIEAAEDRLQELRASVEAATSHSDLDAIDVTAGWP